MPFRNSNDTLPPSKSRLWNFNYKSLAFTLAWNGFSKRFDNQQSSEQQTSVDFVNMSRALVLKGEVECNWGGLMWVQYVVIVWHLKNLLKLQMKATKMKKLSQSKDCFVNYGRLKSISITMIFNFILELLTSPDRKATYSKFDYCGLYHDLHCCCQTFSKKLFHSTSNMFSKLFISEEHFDKLTGNVK